MNNISMDLIKEQYSIERKSHGDTRVFVYDEDGESVASFPADTSDDAIYAALVLARRWFSQGFARGRADMARNIRTLLAEAGE